MYWPEVDFKFSEIAKFGPLLAQKRQNWGKFFYLQTPKKGVYWPFLALILGAPTQALKILTVLGCLERVYQVSRPGKANQPLFWAFSVKRMILYLFLYKVQHAIIIFSCMPFLTFNFCICGGNARDIILQTGTYAFNAPSLWLRTAWAKNPVFEPENNGNCKRIRRSFQGIKLQQTGCMTLCNIWIRRRVREETTRFNI